ncbi:FAD-dependent monooxygenase [Nonomuraea sp. LP-02]|uniref:FAD-dependent oxidoreductase n=1 Tax=Nonomuraea sp. LP-02 TaxID=3097960 RepID=UPI002E3501E4|nr:FAD-dependent monooxygenase [Nonomuraea sp. LP-02]MED7931316.1 FAD-dependent monooxygenase [Nonomuraea sp. LP-02]
MKVIVAGAGLGGLALANGLRGAGIDVAVHERDRSPLVRRQGYRLHLSDVGIDALTSVMAPERRAALLATAHTPAPRFVRFDPTLKELDVLEHDGLHLSVDRQTLRDALLAGVAETIVYGTRLAGFQAAVGHVTARFDDGTTVTGDVLVGADGINSAVRRQYLPHARVVSTGLVQLYGKIPAEPAASMDNVFTAITGPGHRTVGVAYTRDYATCSFGARAEDLPSGLHAMTQDQLRSLVLDMTDGWHPLIRRMIAQWHDVFPLELRTSVPIPPWPTTRVTLLGDAVHAMSPAAGAGANLALRDAAALSAALAHGGPLIPALRSYEQEMIDSGFAAVRVSAANGARFLGQDPLPSG